MPEKIQIRSNYSIHVNRGMLMDIRLSLEAKGLYAFVSTFDQEYTNVVDILKGSDSPTGVVEKAMNELIKHGYFARDRVTG